MFAITTIITLILGTIFIFRKNKTQVIGFMGSSSYWFKTLGISNKVVKTDEAIELTQKWINENVAHNKSVNFTDFVNACYCLEIFKKVKITNNDHVYSNRGTSKLPTTLIGHIKRTRGNTVADAGTGEIKCVNGKIFNDAFSWRKSSVALKNFLSTNGITEMYATGSWRNLSIDVIKELSTNLEVKITVLSQDDEKDMEKKSFIGAMEILEPNIEIIGIHAHGNGSSQGDIINNNFGLKKIKTHVETQINNGSWHNISIEGEGRKQNIVFNLNNTEYDDFVNFIDYIKQDIMTYISINL